MYDGNKSSEKGLILSAFYWGYLCAQIPAGWLASREGGKRVLLVAVGAWSIATLLVWPAYKAGVGFVVVTRVIVGVAEGGNYPAQICLNTLWIPVNERSRAWAFITSGESMGTIIAMAGCPFLYHYAGWQSIFWVSGIMGAAWFLAFSTTSSSPEQSTKISTAELDYILAHREQEMNRNSASLADDNRMQHAAGEADEEKEHDLVPWSEFLHSSAFGGLVVAHFAYNWGTYVIGSWLPTYFSSMFSVDYDALGFFGMLPYIALGM
jgi:MFS family permease